MAPPRANAAKKAALLDQAEEAVVRDQAPVVVGKGSGPQTL